MNHDIYQEIVRLSASGEEAAVATVIAASGSTPREEGAKMLVKADGSIMGTVGGGNIEKQVIQEALDVMRKGKARKMDYRLHSSGEHGVETGMICGGDVEVFIEPIISAPRLYILGGGHIAIPLAKMARLTDFKIIVIDDREGFATTERFPDAAEIFTCDFAASYEKLKIAQNSYIVIVTHGHKGDETALEGALNTPAKYIGMIGSKEKNKAVFSHLLAKGFTQEDLNRVHAPIGIKIMAQTPQEIAVSILAELILVKCSS
jgi:xanthine dehydrogenase accessory factor